MPLTLESTPDDAVFFPPFPRYAPLFPPFEDAFFRGLAQRNARESPRYGERSSYFYDSLPHKHPPSYGLFATTMMLGSRADFTGDLRGKISDYKSTSACTHIYLRGYACFFLLVQEFIYSLLKRFNVFCVILMIVELAQKLTRFLLQLSSTTTTTSIISSIHFLNR